MTITAKVINRLIDTGKVISLVQSQNQADTIVFQIRGEDAALESYYFYIMYKRPSDTIPHIQLLGQPSTSGEYPEVSFSPGSYFTAEDGTVKIQLLGCDASDLTVDPDTGTISGSTLWESLQGYIFVHASQLDATETIIEENVLSEYLAAFQELEGGSRTYASDAEEFARGTRSDGQTVPVVSDDANDNAKYYKGKAKEWATKTGAPVEGVELSAKGYALVSESRANEAEGYAIGTKNGSPAPGFADKNAKDWAIKTGSTVDGTNYSAKQYALDAGESAAIVAAHATQIDAIADDLTKIDGVYAKLTEVEAVADDITKVTAVADDLTKIDGVYDDLSNIDAVQAKLTEIETVSDDIANVNTVAGSIANVNIVAGDKTNVDAVAGNKTNIDTVAGIAADVTAVAGIKADVEAVADIDDDVTDVAGIKADVSAVAAVASDIAAVADELTDIGTVATNIQDVSDVADDIAKVSAVADDLTNIDAVNANKTNIDTVATNIADISDVADDIAKVASVADDLTNIDAVADDLENIDDAVTNASLARQYAEGKKLDGTDVVSGEAGYHNNAKYWADAVPALQAQVNANSARITNLEQTTKQDEQTVSYPDDGNYSSIMPNGVPARVAKYGLVKSIDGKSRAWNQLVQNGNFASSDGWGSNYASISVSSNKCVFTSTTANSNQSLFRDVSLTAGHKYLCICTVKLSEDTSFFRINLSGNFSDVVSISANTKTTIMQIVSVSSISYGQMYLYPNGDTGLSVGETCEFEKIFLRDLTTILDDWNPSDITTANIPLMVQQIPDLLKWDAYDAGSLVDTVVSGVKSVGVNIWDEQTREGYYNSAGTYISDSGELCTKNLIEVMPSTTYYYKNDGYQTLGNVCFYDANGNFILRTDTAATFTTPANAKYVNMSFGANYGATYNHDICVNISGSLNGQYKPWVNHSTLMLSSPFTGKSAGAVTEVLTLQTGKKTRPIGSVDLSTLSWGESGGVYYASLADMAFDAEGVCSNYVVTHKNAPDLSDGEMNCGYNAGYLQIKTSSSPTGILNYELATPLSDEQVCDPIPDNFIEVEGGGTINTIQTQTPVIDNCLDVTYDFIPA